MAVQARTGKGSRDSVRGGRAGEKPKPLTVAVFGAGAPHASLMAGALAYIYTKGKTFDIFYTSGGGALIGLIFVAPKTHKRADEALREVAEFGVDERIYRLFPVGYKTFFKNSRFTQHFQDWARRYKLEVEPRPFPGQTPPAGYDAREQRRRRLFNDSVDLWASLLTPPTIGPTSLGICSALPFLEEMVDFERVNNLASPSGFKFDIPIVLPDGSVYTLKPGWFYVNAYNLERKQLEQFSNAFRSLEDVERSETGAGALTPLAVRAALAFPFVYPPEKIREGLYCEGADIDPLNLPGVYTAVRDIPSKLKSNEAADVQVYLFDILGSLEKDLMCGPRDLWDAYGLSIVTPVVSLAKMSKTIFCQNPKNLDPIVVPFKIPDKRRGRPLDWSYANTTAMFDAGWAAGKKFIDDHGDKLPKRVDP
jgi:NTE family protein